MKKSLITLIAALAIILIALSVRAQQTAPPPAKPKPALYTLNLDKPMQVTITFTIPVGNAYNWVTTFQNGGPDAIQNSDFTGKQITAILGGFKAVQDSLAVGIIKQYNQYVLKDQAKFKADTTALYHGKGLKQ